MGGRRGAPPRARSAEIVTCRSPASYVFVRISRRSRVAQRGLALGGQRARNGGAFALRPDVAAAPAPRGAASPPTSPGAWYAPWPQIEPSCCPPVDCQTCWPFRMSSRVIRTRAVRRSRPARESAAPGGTPRGRRIRGSGRRPQRAAEEPPAASVGCGHGVLLFGAARSRGRAGRARCSPGGCAPSARRRGAPGAGRAPARSCRPRAGAVQIGGQLRGARARVCAVVVVLLLHDVDRAAGPRCRVRPGSSGRGSAPPSPGGRAPRRAWSARCAARPRGQVGLSRVDLFHLVRHARSAPGDLGAESRVVVARR